MKSSYNAQEEINDLINRFGELQKRVESRLDALEQMVVSLEKSVADAKSRQNSGGQNRRDIKVENLEGTLAQKLRTIGEFYNGKKK